MKIFDAKTYREYLRFRLGVDSETKKRGSIKALSEYVVCHPTYASQVLRGISDFNNEQGVKCCQYFQLNEDETEFFIDLLNCDRAGDKATKAHFQNRIDRRRNDHLNMKKRWKVKSQLTAEQQLRYYESWIPQALHMLSQIDEGVTAEEAAAKLHISKEAATRLLQSLAEIGLVHEKEGDGRYTSLLDSVHLGTDSTALVRHHLNWRAKVSSDLTTQGIGSGTHYSSLMTMSPADALIIKKFILDHLEASREVIIKSPSEKLYCYLLDFYPLG